MSFQRRNLIICISILFIFVFIFCNNNPYSLQEGATSKNCFDSKKYKAYDKNGKTKICNSKTNLYANLKGCSFFSKNTNYKCDDSSYYGGYGNGSGNGNPPTNPKNGIQWS